MQTLEAKVKEAEIIAENLLQEFREKSTETSNKYNDENAVGLRDKIYHICQMLYEQ